MTQRPGQLGIDLQVEVRIGVVDDLVHLELIEAQEPIRLVKPVLAHQRRSRQGWQAGIVAIHGDEARIIDPLHRGTTIESRREAQDIPIPVGGSPDDHLRALAGRNEGSRAFLFRQ